MKYKQLVCKTCQTQFEVPHWKQSIYCSKSCKNKDPELVKKSNATRKQTWEDLYGGHPMSLPEVQEVHKKSMVKKYGVTHALKSQELMQKSMDTKLDRYGDSFFYDKGKAKETKLQRYGSVNNHLKRTLSTLENRSKLYEDLEILDTTQHEMITNNKYTIRCRECNTVWDCMLMNNYRPRCKVCSSKYNKMSKGQAEVVAFIRECIPGVEVLTNSRKLLKNSELNIYIPSLDLAFEFNGLFWHSDRFVDKDYHLRKTRRCLSAGVSLIHIFEHEWVLHRPLLESMIRNKLGVTSRKIHGRKCKVKFITPAVKRDFLDSNHLHGNVRSSVNIGVFYEESLVAVLTMAAPRFDKVYEWEVIRFATLANCSVHGGFSKALKFFITQYSPKSILTYADRCWSSGEVYYRAGFSLVGFTPPNYFYWKNGRVYPRQMFQKHKLASILEVFDARRSEYDNMVANKYNRFWNSGNVKLSYFPSSRT